MNGMYIACITFVLSCCMQKKFIASYYTTEVWKCDLEISLHLKCIMRNKIHFSDLIFILSNDSIEIFSFLTFSQKDLPNCSKKLKKRKLTFIMSSQFTVHTLQIIRKVSCLFYLVLRVGGKW